MSAKQRSHIARLSRKHSNQPVSNTVTYESIVHGDHSQLRLDVFCLVHGNRRHLDWVRRRHPHRRIVSLGPFATHQTSFHARGFVSLRARRHHRTSNALASSPSSRRSTSTYSSIRFNTRPFATFVTACASSPASVYERIDRDRFVRGASSSNASTRPPSIVRRVNHRHQHPNAIPSSHRARTSRVCVAPRPRRTAPFCIDDCRERARRRRGHLARFTCDALRPVQRAIASRRESTVAPNVR